MITLKDFMEVVEFRITEGSDYYSSGYGPKAYTLSYWNGDHNGHSLNIIFDTDTQSVYQVEVCDYAGERAYRYTNEQFRKTLDQDKEAWEFVNWIDLETKEDWLEKASAIVKGEEYDTRISIPIEFSDAELLKYMTMAHERDMTFNQLVEEALQNAIDEMRRDPEALKARVEIWKAENDIT